MEDDREVVSIFDFLNPFLIFVDEFGVDLVAWIGLMELLKFQNCMPIFGYGSISTTVLHIIHLVAVAT